MLKWLPAQRRRARADRSFDRAHEVETARWVRAPALETESPNRRHAVRYEPSDAEEFSSLMAKLDIDHRDFVFVDYGSGKGRVLIMAASFPFKRIIGVEFSEPLDRVARRNVATLGAGVPPIETFVLDAVDFDPPDDPLVLYFFNPFGPEVLTAVLHRVSKSLASNPRPAYIVATAPPEFAETIEAAGFEALDVDWLGWRTRGVFGCSGSVGPSTRVLDRRGVGGRQSRAYTGS